MLRFPWQPNWTCSIKSSGNIYTRYKFCQYSFTAWRVVYFSLTKLSQSCIFPEQNFHNFHRQKNSRLRYFHNKNFICIFSLTKLAQSVYFIDKTFPLCVFSRQKLHNLYVFPTKLSQFDFFHNLYIFSHSLNLFLSQAKKYQSDIF